jgi:hypothetical protein
MRAGRQRAGRNPALQIAEGLLPPFAFIVGASVAVGHGLCGRFGRDAVPILHEKVSFIDDAMKGGARRTPLDGSYSPNLVAQKRRICKETIDAFKQRQFLIESGSDL